MISKSVVILIFSFACAQALENEKVNIGGTEYFFSTEELSWEKSSAECHGMEMNMLAIETETENAAIFAYLESNGWTSDYFWTGGMELNDTATTDGIWTWVDLEQTFEFTFWLDGRPNPFARGFCMYLTTSSWDNYWLDAVCGAPARYVCEARPQ